MFEKTNELIQKYLENHPGGETYPSGMSRLFKLLEDGDWNKIYDEATTFSAEGDSDIRLKVTKVLKTITKEEFEKEMNQIISLFEELVKDNISLSTIDAWYQEIKSLNAFKLVDKRIGNGIPNAMLGGLHGHMKTNGRKMINFFTMRSGENNKHYNNFVNNNMLAISWTGIDDITTINDEQLRSYTNQKYEKGKSFSQFNTFKNAMSIGDIVVLIRKGTKEVSLCVITSDIIYSQSNPVLYSNYRTMEILKDNIALDFVYHVQTAITQIFNEQRIKTLKNELDEDTMLRYEEIMSNIDIDRDFVFEYIANEELIEEDKVEYLNDHKQLIIDGAPGTGKSYYVNTEIVGNSKNYERVTFYADYEYHNFVGSILPVMKDNALTYDFVQGPFSKILNAALSTAEEQHFLIIEELTRGNASGIFGDIFQLLDRTSEGWSEYPVTNDNIFNSLDPEVCTFLETEYQGKIVLPPNLSIICTINSSDQNVYPLDTAFKRRFTYQVQSTKVTDLEQQESLKFEVRFGAKTYQWYNLYTKLNEFFLGEMQLKEDKQIGPYFIKQGDEAEMIKKLVVYLWNDINKVHTMTGIKLFNNNILTMADLQEMVIDSSNPIEDIFSPEFLKFIGQTNEQE